MFCMCTKIILKKLFKWIPSRSCVGPWCNGTRCGMRIPRLGFNSQCSQDQSVPYYTRMYNQLDLQNYHNLVSNNRAVCTELNPHCICSEMGKNEKWKNEISWCIYLPFVGQYNFISPLKLFFVLESFFCYFLSIK